jgi:hypothetical protein
MYPYLVEIGPLKIASYGTMVALAFLMRISEESCQPFRLKLASDSGGKLPAVSV